MVREQETRSLKTAISTEAIMQIPTKIGRPLNGTR